MNRASYRRLKRIALSMDLQLEKFELIAFLRKLPDDAKLMGVGEDFSQGCSYLVFHSEEWSVVHEGSQLPTFDPWINRAETEEAKTVGPGEPGFNYGELEQRILAQCICDLAYTGARYHNKDCPLKSLDRVGKRR